MQAKRVKDQVLWLYQQVTARSRSVLLEELRAKGNVPIAILFYHRVADTQINDWTISTKDFSEHLDWLQGSYDIVSLGEAQNRIRSESCDRPTVAITFDDGYSDNGDFAIPELARRNLPATYFVSTTFVETGEPFPHDVAANAPLAPNTIEQLKQYQELGIEIGAHTRTHPDLGKFTLEKFLQDEIVGSIHDLQQWLGSDIRYFAFPYGLPHNTSQLAVDVLQQSGVQGFCTAYGAWNWPGNPGFHLRRIHADAGLARLQNWLTLDSRKLVDNQQLPFVEPGIEDLMLATQLLAQ